MTPDFGEGNKFRGNFIRDKDECNPNVHSWEISKKKENIYSISHHVNRLRTK